LKISKKLDYSVLFLFFSISFLAICSQPKIKGKELQFYAIMAIVFWDVAN
jgi:hypothetical protein